MKVVEALSWTSIHSVELFFSVHLGVATEEVHGWRDANRMYYPMGWSERRAYRQNTTSLAVITSQYFPLVLFYLNKAVWENGELIPAHNKRNAVECSISGYVLQSCVGWHFDLIVMVMDYTINIFCKYRWLLTKY